MSTQSGSLCALAAEAAMTPLPASIPSPAQSDMVSWFVKKDPTDRALLAVLQFLEAQGLTETVRVLQEETTITTGRESIGGSVLLSALDLYETEYLARQTSTEAKVGDHWWDEVAKIDEEPATEERDTLDLKSNLVAVDMCNDFLAAAAADKSIRVMELASKGDILVPDLPSLQLTSPAICVHFHPVLSHLLLCCCMNGEAVVANHITGEIVASFKAHEKHAVTGRWAPDGSSFATGARDHTVQLYRAKGDETWEHTAELMHQGAVEAVEYLTPSTLVVCARDDHQIHAYDTTTGQETECYNMNARGDSHVSFAGLHMRTSNNGKWLLVATDKSRSIMFEAGSSVQARNFYGADNDVYSTPRVGWSPSSRHVYSTSQNHVVVGWDVASERVVSTMKGHTSKVRDLASHPSQNLLASGSFDHTIKLWQPKETR